MKEKEIKLREEVKVVELGFISLLQSKGLKLPKDTMCWIYKNSIIIAKSLHNTHVPQFNSIINIYVGLKPTKARDIRKSLIKEIKTQIDIGFNGAFSPEDELSCFKLIVSATIISNWEIFKTEAENHCQIVKEIHKKFN